MLAWPTILTPFRSTTWPTWLPSTLPPLSTARSTTTEPDRILSTMARLTRRGAGLPGSAPSITRSWLFRCWATMSACCFRSSSDSSGVAARGRRRVPFDHADELGAKAFDLLLGRRPDVGRRDYGAQAARQRSPADRRPRRRPRRPWPAARCRPRSSASASPDRTRRGHRSPPG